VLLKERIYPLFVLGCLLLLGLVLVITLSNAWHYHYQDFADDVRFVVTYKAHGIFNGVNFLFNHHNGRLVSHLLFLVLSPWVTTNHFTEIVFYVVNLLLFMGSLAFFLKSFFQFRYGLKLSGFRLFLTAGLLYSLLFFFYFGKRFEFWFWMASIPIYQYSLMLMLILNGLLLREKISKMQVAAVIFISLCLGFMSETHALAQMIILGLLLIGKEFRPGNTFKTPKVWCILSGFLIGLSLIINYLSRGNQHKLLISKTNLPSATAAPIKAFYILINDLALSWDSVIWKAHEAYAFNALFLQVICIALLVLFLKVFLGNWFKARDINSLEIEKKNSLTVLAAGVLILLTTYFVSAVLYANLLDFIVDRCKFVGCLAVFFGLFDFVAMTILQNIARKPGQSI